MPITKYSIAELPLFSNTMGAVLVRGIYYYYYDYYYYYCCRVLGFARARRGFCSPDHQNLSKNGKKGRPNMTAKMAPCALTEEAANHAQ